MYPNLKLTIFKLGVRQIQLAKDLGIADASLSKIIHGYSEPSKAIRERIAKYLNADEAWLFSVYDARAHAVSTAASGEKKDGGQ